MGNTGFMELNFAMYFEPENGVTTPSEFTGELLRWAEKEQHRLWIREESMEPRIELDGEAYVCRLGEPSLAVQKGFLRKKPGIPGINRPFGGILGYQWVYLYKE